MPTNESTHAPFEKFEVRAGTRLGSFLVTVAPINTIGPTWGDVQRDNDKNERFIEDAIRVAIERREAGR